MKSKLARNIPLYYAGEFFGELLFIIPIFVAFERQYLTFSQMSVLAAARFGLTLMLELPTGAFADLFGRKASVALGYVINTAGLITIALSTSASPLIIGTVVRAIGDSLISGSDVALVYDSLKELGREKEFGKIRANGVLAVQCAIIISSILAGYLFQAWNGLPYLSYGIATLVAAAIFWSMTEPTIDTQKFTLSNYISQNVKGFKQLFKTPLATRMSIFYAFVGGITWAWQIEFSQMFASSIGYDEVQKGWLFALIRFVNVIIIIRLLHLERLLTKSRAFLFFPILILLGTVPAIFQSQIIGTVLLFLMTLASTLRFIVLDQYMNELFDSHVRATALSSLNLLVGILFVLIVPCIGTIMDRFPSYMVMLFGAIITLIFILPQGLALSKRFVNVSAQDAS